MMDNVVDDDILSLGYIECIETLHKMGNYREKVRFESGQTLYIKTSYYSVIREILCVCYAGDNRLAGIQPIRLHQ